MNAVQDTSVFEVQRYGDVLIVIPRGSLWSREVQRIEAEANDILEAINGEPMRHVLLDLRKTDWFGATALGWFVRLWKRVRCCGGQMAFCHVSDRQKEVLQVTGLDRLWPVCAARSQALHAIANPKTNRLRRESIWPATCAR